MRLLAKYCSLLSAIGLSASAGGVGDRGDWRLRNQHHRCGPPHLDAPDAEESCRLLRARTNRDLPLPVIAYSWEAGGRRYCNASRKAAFDTLSQPLDVQQLPICADRACRRGALARELADARETLGSTRVEGLLGNSKAMERVCEVTRKVAEVFTTVLITGGERHGKGPGCPSHSTGMSPRSVASHSSPFRYAVS